MRNPEQANPQQQDAGRGLPGARGSGEAGSNCPTGAGLPFGAMRMFPGVVAVQYHEGARCYSVVHLKVVNFTLCKSHVNKKYIN